jgi:hypothetical protein
MKTILILLIISLFGLSACFATNKNTAEDGVKSMRIYSNLERQECPKNIYRGVGKRIECKYKVRTELHAKYNDETK